MKRLFNIRVNSATKASQLSKKLKLEGRFNWVDKVYADYEGKTYYTVWYETKED